MADRVLILGGAGFIGANFAAMIAASPSRRAVVYDSLTYAGSRAAVPPGVEFIHADIRDARALRAAMAGADAIVNFAAHSNVDRSIADPWPFLESNIRGVMTILECLRAAKSSQRFVHVSTDEVYGDTPCGTMHDEAAPARPSNPYAATKAAADMLVLSYVRTHDLNACITRCTNNYGPWSSADKLVARAITRMIDGRRVPIHGDGEMRRDWTWVGDHCDAIDRALQFGRAGEIYNIAALCDRSVNEVVGAIAAHFGKTLSDATEKHTDRHGNDRSYAIAPGKAAAAFGWRPGPPIEARLAALVAWYRHHRAWWAPAAPGGLCGAVAAHG